MSIDEVARELYGVPPGEFVAVRAARVKEARAAGDRELAGAIGRLRKPGAAAALVNQLVRRHPAVVEGLLALGADLRAAQRSLDGARLKELDRARRAALDEAIGVVRELAGGPVSRAIEDAVGETLRAALADEDAAHAVADGLLVEPLSSAGFGPAELGELIALPLRRDRAADAVEPDEAGTRAREAARDALAATEAALRDAEDRLEGAHLVEADAQSMLDEVEARRRELVERLQQAATDREAAAAGVASAARDRDTAQRALDDLS